MTATVSNVLISRAPRIGARLGVRVEGCLIWVSTILYGRQRYTRVEADECEAMFYLGEIEGDQAARAYLHGVQP